MNRKLYVWDDVFEDYTSGCAMAFATSKEDAARQIADAKNPAAGWTNSSREEAAINAARWADMDYELLMSRECAERELDQPFAFWMYGGG